VIGFYKKYFLDTYIHLAFCVGMLTAFTYSSISFPIDWQLVAATFLGSLMIYNYHDVLTYDTIQFMIWIKSKAVLVPLICASISGWLILEHFETSFVPLLISVVACVLYFRPINGKDYSLRAITFFKIFLISLVFGLITTTIPLIDANYAIKEILWMTLARMAFIAALAIAFDIGDLLVDQKSNTSTLPSVVGNKNAKWIGSLLLIIAGLIEAYCAWNFMLEVPALFVMAIVYFVSWILLLSSSPQRTKHFYLFAVDGMMGLPFLLSLVFGI
jgi:4-hydroxybenzoate polyprenyltransferase